MPQVKVDVSVEDIKAMISQLPVPEFMVLVDALQERAETIAMMRLAETGFPEWNEEGEDIYDRFAKPVSRKLPCSGLKRSLLSMNRYCREDWGSCLPISWRKRKRL